MSDAKNPFAEDGSRSRGISRSTIVAWLAAIVMAGIAGVAVYERSIAREEVRRLEALPASLEEANERLASSVSESERNRATITNLQAKVAELEKQKNATVDSAKRLEDEMRSQLESRDVTISKLQGKLTVNILDRVLFDSGEAVLKPDGEAVLRKVASLLADHPELKIHVIGHTDNVPIRSRFMSNWELSTSRALAAVHFLVEQAGVAPTRVGAVGYGEHRPIADNSTAEGRAKNRRIAITILPDELVGSDTVPTASTNAPAVGPGQSHSATNSLETPANSDLSTNSTTALPPTNAPAVP